MVFEGSLIEIDFDFLDHFSPIFRLAPKIDQASFVALASISRTTTSPTLKKIFDMPQAKFFMEKRWFWVRPMVK